MRDSFVERVVQVFIIGRVTVVNLGLIYFPTCILYLFIFLETGSYYAVHIVIGHQTFSPSLTSLVLELDEYANIPIENMY
jgi:hypothetical protein